MLLAWICQSRKSEKNCIMEPNGTASTDYHIGLPTCRAGVNKKINWNYSIKFLILNLN